MRVGAQGSLFTVTGTRTADVVSLRYSLKGASGEVPAYAVDYAIDRTGLALEPKVPGEPVLMRACPLGEL